MSAPSTHLRCNPVRDRGFRRHRRRNAQGASVGEGRIRAAKPLLRLQRAAVYREQRLVIGPFDWTLERGQHWCLRGANGSGKSTFVALLYGDLWPAHGGTARALLARSR